MENKPVKKKANERKYEKRMILNDFKFSFKEEKSKLSFKRISVKDAFKCLFAKIAEFFSENK